MWIGRTIELITSGLRTDKEMYEGLVASRILRHEQGA